MKLPFARLLLLLVVGAGSAAAQPRLAVDAPAWDFGSLDQSQTIRREFVLRNAGTRPLEIREITSSCGCTAAEPGSRHLAPGAETALAVSVDLRGRRGPQDFRVVVHTNDPEQPATQLSVSGTVTSAVAVDPPGIFFGQLLLDSRETRSVEIRADRNAGDLAIEQVVVPDDAPFTVTTTPIRAGRSYRLSVATTPPLPEGPLASSFRIRTDSDAAPEIRVDVYGYVVGKLMVAPAELRLIPVPGTAAVARYILVRPGTVTDFKVEKVDVPDPAMRAQITASGGGYRIRVSDIRVSPELEGKEIVIHTDVPDYERIPIPITLLAPGEADSGPGS